MPYHEEFADPVIVPGPNLRGRFSDTEAVDDAVTAQSDEDASHVFDLRFACPGYGGSSWGRGGEPVGSGLEGRSEMVPDGGGLSPADRGDRGAEQP